MRLLLLAKEIILAIMFFAICSHSLPTMKIASKLTTRLFQISTGDIVFYSPSDGKIGIGVLSDDSKISVLVRRGTDKELTQEMEFHENEDIPEILTKNARILGVCSDVYWTQRIVEDRVSNPHGEHAEDVWILKVQELRDNATKNNISFEDFLRQLDDH